MLWLSFSVVGGEGLLDWTPLIFGLIIYIHGLQYRLFLFYDGDAYRFDLLVMCSIEAFWNFLIISWAAAWYGAKADSSRENSPWTCLITKLESPMTRIFSAPISRDMDNPNKSTSYSAILFVMSEISRMSLANNNTHSIHYKPFHIHIHI